MKASLCLHVPAYEELWYRQKIMQDPDTMSYNKGYDLNFHGYDEATGCIAFPKEKWADWYEMGIVLEAKHRGKGYAVAALRLLLQHAFEKIGVEAVHNEFEEERSAALQTHLSAGFTKYRQENKILELLITKEQYFRQKAIDCAAN